jgi:hypothetical protein
MTLKIDTASLSVWVPYTAHGAGFHDKRTHRSRLAAPQRTLILRVVADHDVLDVLGRPTRALACSPASAAGAEHPLARGGARTGGLETRRPPGAAKLAGHELLEPMGVGMLVCAGTGVVVGVAVRRFEGRAVGARKMHVRALEIGKQRLVPDAARAVLVDCVQCSGRRQLIARPSWSAAPRTFGGLGERVDHVGIGFARASVVLKTRVPAVQRGAS